VSDFAALAAIARAAVEAVHGDAVTLKPMDAARGPHGSPRPSVERPEQTVRACFFFDTDLEIRRRARPMIGQTGAQMMNRSPDIFASLPAACGAIAGDLIVRDKDGVRQVFEIMTRDPDDVGDLIVGLASVKVL
jgi:hypothetical protein